MEPLQWPVIITFLLVAIIKVSHGVGDQGEGGGDPVSGASGSGAADVPPLLLQKPPPPPSLMFMFDEEEVVNAIINERPEAEEYPDPPDMEEEGYTDEQLLKRVPRGAYSSYSSKSSYGSSSSSYQPSYSSVYSTKCSGPEGYPGCCKPLALCAQYYGTEVHYRYDSTNYYKSCVYGYGYHGVCCPDVSYSGNYGTYVINYNPKRYGYSGQYSNIPPNAIQQAIRYALEFYEKNYRHDQFLGRGEDDPSYWGNGVVKEKYLDEILDIGAVGAILALASQFLQNYYGFRPESYYDGGYIGYRDIAPYLPYKYRQVCENFDKKCYPSKYYSLDGSCNNLKYPAVGSAYSPMGYIAIPKYSDGVYQPRHSMDHRPLSKVRPMRYDALPDKDVEEKYVNMYFMVYGQLLAHDVSHVPFYQAEDGQFLDCCAGYKMGDEEVSDKCYAIALPPDDGFYKYHRKESLDCLNFARSVISPNYYCSLGYASKLNRQTHFLDCSIAYGISKNESDKLRVGKYGLLKFSKVGHQHYLPIDKDAECFQSSSDFCFSSGDLRTTLWPGVTVGQTIIMRFHNYCAKKLYKINPHWSDDQLFYEARRITIAVFQHITYTEYLPILIGWKFMYDYGILPPSTGYSYDYDPDVKPWTFHEFAGAAFRHHSGIYGKIVLADEYYKAERALPVEEHYNSGLLLKNPYHFEKILRGFMLVPQRKVDEYYDPAVSDLLLKNNRTFGLDLPTFNVKRGRDFGIASYNDFREICGLKRAQTWADFYDTIDPHVVAKFAQYYRYPDDVDLYTGGVAERHIKDSYIGPTWWCVVGHQFQVWKRGDRYFYTHGGMPHSFTEAQLEEIRKMTQAAVLCVTSYLKTVPTFAFRTISPGNPLVSCEDMYSLPRMSFAPWKE